MTWCITVAPRIPSPEQDGVGVGEAGDEPPGDARGVVGHDQRVEQEAEQDDGQHPGDHDLEAPVAAGLEPEQRRRRRR